MFFCVLKVFMLCFKAFNDLFFFIFFKFLLNVVLLPGVCFYCLLSLLPINLYLCGSF